MGGGYFYKDSTHKWVGRRAVVGHVPNQRRNLADPTLRWDDKAHASLGKQPEAPQPNQRLYNSGEAWEIKKGPARSAAPFLFPSFT